MICGKSKFLSFFHTLKYKQIKQGIQENLFDFCLKLANLPRLIDEQVMAHKMRERLFQFCLENPSRRQFGKRLLGFFTGIGLLGKASARQKLIMMNTFSIAGFQFHDGIHQLDELRVNQPLALAAEPDNPYDEFAVKILTPDGLDLGYVPRSDNKAISRLLLAGVPLNAQVTALRPDAEPWQRVQVKVLMAV